MAKSSPMRRAICFDTAPVIWGVREISARGDERMIVRTPRYIKYLNNSKFVIMVPAPVVAEYLVGASATEMYELDILISN
jgi:hypothetical protein